MKLVPAHPCNHKHWTCNFSYYLSFHVDLHRIITKPNIWIRTKCLDKNSKIQRKKIRTEKKTFIMPSFVLYEIEISKNAEFQSIIINYNSDIRADHSTLPCVSIVGFEGLTFWGPPVKPLTWLKVWMGLWWLILDIW